MKTSTFSYELNPELIAQQPASPRDQSRLFVVKTGDSNIKTSHEKFFNIPDHLKAGDLLVFNNSKVFPARLRGKKETGGKIEVLLLEQEIPENPEFHKNPEETWQALLKPGRRIKVGDFIHFHEKLKAQVERRSGEIFFLKFNQEKEKLKEYIDKLGEAPTPPYIKNAPSDLGKYQTVYAQKRGSAAAPTAGLHFTNELRDKLRDKGVEFANVTLHVGLGTFQPVKEDEAEKHHIHTEKYSVLPSDWQKIHRARQDNRRIIAVGTTSCRVLETLGKQEKVELAGETNLYILPGFKFQITNSLITNFHLPESTLLMLVSAFLGEKLKDHKKGIEVTKRLYQEAIAKKYRFYSFGDSMFIE